MTVDSATRDHANDPAVIHVLRHLDDLEALNDDADDPFTDEMPFGAYAKVEVQPDGHSVFVFPDPKADHWCETTDDGAEAPRVPAGPVVRITVERIA